MAHAPTPGRSLAVAPRPPPGGAAPTPGAQCEPRVSPEDGGGSRSYRLTHIQGYGVLSRQGTEYSSIIRPLTPLAGSFGAPGKSVHANARGYPVAHPTALFLPRWRV